MSDQIYDPYTFKDKALELLRQLPMCLQDQALDIFNHHASLSPKEKTSTFKHRGKQVSEEFKEGWNAALEEVNIDLPDYIS